MRTTGGKAFHAATIGLPADKMQPDVEPCAHSQPHGHELGALRQHALD
jgi:hypothetical protein